MNTSKEQTQNLFTTSFRGYTKEEVDAYIAKLTAQNAKWQKTCEELKAQNAELESELAALRENEDTIRRALIDSQNAATRIVENAKQKSRDLEKLSRQKCGEVIARFREEVRTERECLNALRTQSAAFKSRLYAQYQEHISLIESLTKGLEEEHWDLTPTDATRSVLSLLRGEIDRRTRNDEIEEEKLDSEIGDVIDTIAKTQEDASEAQD